MRKRVIWSSWESQRRLPWNLTSEPRSEDVSKSGMWGTPFKAEGIAYEKALRPEVLLKNRNKVFWGKEKGAGNETVVSTRHLTSMKFLEAKGILTPTDLQWFPTTDTSQLCGPSDVASLSFSLCLHSADYASPCLAKESEWNDPSDALPCPSLSPGVFSNSRPVNRWCSPPISSSAALFSFCLQSFPASGFFPNEPVLHVRWPKYWNFSFSISPSNEYSELIFCRIDWFDLLAVQGTFKSLLQHHNSKDQFFTAQPSVWSSSHICTWLLEIP